MDDVYAFPLRHVPALAPIPNDAERAAYIAADALLTYMTTVDLTMTEYGRSYLQLVHEYRADHLAGLRAFRTAQPEEIAGWPPYLFVARYFGSHTEISVDAATGVATNVLFEID